MWIYIKAACSWLLWIFCACRAHRGNTIFSACAVDGANQLSHGMTKPTKWHVRPPKTQIRLGGSSLAAWRKLGSLTTHWVHSKDSGQTAWMPKLIWVFTGRTVILLVCHVMAQLSFMQKWLVRELINNCIDLVDRQYTSYGYWSVKSRNPRLTATLHSTSSVDSWAMSWDYGIFRPL